MDTEKQFSTISFASGPLNRATTPRPPLSITVIRAMQYIWSIISLVFISCAIDRNILVPGVTAEEKALGVSAVLAAIVVLYHFLRPYPTRITVVIDSILASFLFAAFVYGAYNAVQRHGACSLPDKIGAWDNTRGCKRMTVAASFSAINFASFTASAVLAALLADWIAKNVQAEFDMFQVNWRTGKVYVGDMLVIYAGLNDERDEKLCGRSQ